MVAAPPTFALDLRADLARLRKARRGTPQGLHVALKPGRAAESRG